VKVKVLEKRSIIPLDKNEGVYIRNLNSGEVRLHMGSSILLEPDEELWEKEMQENIEKLYLAELNMTKRNKSRVIAFKCPFNSVMQIYNLKLKENRIVLGPNLAILKPEEEFTLVKLSGKTPKIENCVHTLYLKLGPIFSSDEILVETEDHTRLIMKIAYNWKFDIKNNEKEALKIFSVRDFIGDMCSNLASKIRSYIATIKFEDFHKNSDLYIKKSVFGEKEGVLQESTSFADCNLLINNVDIKSITPCDPNTRLLLQKSVSLAIELATNTIEQEYTILLKTKEQEFKGELEKLKITNEINFLNKNIELNKLMVESNIIEKTGLSRAQAQARKEASSIESKSQVILAEKERDANEIEVNYEISKMKKMNDNEYLKKSEEQRLTLKQEVEKNKVESSKFSEICKAIGPETLVEIAKAGPELQAKLLSGLNLSGYILTNGNNPINLFNVANNMVKNE